MVDMIGYNPFYEYVIKFLILIFWFLIVWCGGFYLHEICHAFDCLLQGTKFKIKFWWHKGIPSLMCIPDKELKNKRRNLFLGGFLSGIIMLGYSVILLKIGFYSPIPISLFIIGVINIGYSFYEMMYHPMVSDWKLAKYMRIKNYVYLLYGFLATVMVSSFIYEWLMGFAHIW